MDWSAALGVGGAIVYRIASGKNPKPQTGHDVDPRCGSIWVACGGLGVDAFVKRKDFSTSEYFSDGRDVAGDYQCQIHRVAAL